MINNQPLLLALENRFGLEVLEANDNPSEADIILSKTSGILLVDGYNLTQRKARNSNAMLDAAFDERHVVGADVVNRMADVGGKYESLMVLVDICNKEKQKINPWVVFRSCFRREVALFHSQTRGTKTSELAFVRVPAALDHGSGVRHGTRSGLGKVRDSLHGYCVLEAGTRRFVDQVSL